MSDLLHARVALKHRSRENAEACASQLEKLGFSVEHVGVGGVGFEGAPSLFADVFRTVVADPDDAPHFAGSPTLPDELAGNVESVYFPTRPTRFD